MKYFLLCCALVTAWTVACQAPLSMRFPGQKYWSGLPFPAPGDLSDPGIKVMSLAYPALAGRFFATVPPGKPQHESILMVNFYLCKNYICIIAYPGDHHQVRIPCALSFLFRVSVPPGIKPAPPAVEAQSLNHWTAREGPPCPLSKWYLSMPRHKCMNRAPTCQTVSLWAL